MPTGFGDVGARQDREQKELARKAEQELEAAQKQDAKLSKKFNRPFDPRTGSPDLGKMFDDEGDGSE